MRPWFLPLLALTGCGGGGDSPAPPPSEPAQAARPVAQSDEEIAALLYSDRQRTPAGFPLDPSPAGHEQVTTMHLAGCTDDWNEALTWSETAANDAPVYSDLAATITDRRYYEFGRTPRTAADDYIRMRVYRCAFFDPVAGALNVRPLDAETVGEFAAYQWQFTSYNNFGNVVLERATRTTATAIEHTLDLATLARAAEAGACDRVDVIAWTWRVLIATGKVEVTTTPLFGFRARLAGGLAEVCGA
ncbi:MAG: hypothetical protein AB7P31_04730 [Steroidobacteraceae bacterium]